ncbi:hypothetical protein [Stakelama tenebrarum]|uniref:hypothetical protein n=1 Tax=Stakelama tenebrarum TaxID=2711215 RepID=UPI0019D20753|nr:hypothetical protein [Sphingosinithalassobacter tenebrarum]
MAASMTFFGVCGIAFLFMSLDGDFSDAHGGSATILRQTNDWRANGVHVPLVVWLWCR